MRDRIAVRVDLLDEVRAVATATGRSFDETFARVLARGLLRRIEAELAPLLDDSSLDAATPPALADGATSESVYDHAETMLPGLGSEPGSSGDGPPA